MNYLLINNRTQSVGIKWDCKNEDHLELIEKAIRQVLPKVKYDYELRFLKQGVTVYLKAESKMRPLFGYKRLRFTGDELDKVHGYFFFHAFKGIEMVKEFCGKYVNENDLQPYSKNLIYLKNSKLEDLPKLLSNNNLLEVMLDIVLKKDIKAIESRKRMEARVAKEIAIAKKSKKTIKNNRK